MTDQEPFEQGNTSPGSVGAEVMPRFLARLIDSIIVGFATIPIVLIMGLTLTSFAVGVTSAVIVIAYFTLMESYTGQTIGKMLLKLRTVGPGGGNPSLEAALRRNGWYIIGIVPYIGGLVQFGVAIYIAMTISQSVTNTGWHDTFAGGTQVETVAA